MSRISRDEWGVCLATTTAERGTCLRRKVGCVLVDSVGRVLATGYNGVARGLPHCNERVLGEFEEVNLENLEQSGRLTRQVTFPNACPGAFLPSGTGLETCEAIHAEQNALLACRDPDAVETCYITVSPCIHCVKMLMNTGCRRIVFREPYVHDETARELWWKIQIGEERRQWIHLPAH